VNLRKAAYAKDRLAKVRGFSLRKRQIIGGLDLGRFYPELKDCLLVCVTEQNSRPEIDALAKALGGGR